MLAHSRSWDFAYRQAPMIVCVLVPSLVGLIVKALHVVFWLT